MTNGRGQKFIIAYKYDFSCQFCGAKVDHDQIEIDHMVPKSMGGSDRLENLTCACKKCNQSKSSAIAFPRSICEGQDSIDPDWTVLRSFGNWQIKFHPFDGIVVEHTPPRYWVSSSRAHCSYLFNHMMEKSWFTQDELGHFTEAIDYLQRLISERKKEKEGE